MRRLFTYLTENVREHLMAYIAFWLLLALIDFIYILYAGQVILTKVDITLIKPNFRAVFLNESKQANQPASSVIGSFFPMWDEIIEGHKANYDEKTEQN